MLIRDSGAPDAVAGHSIGAFAAAVIAGAITFDEAINAVYLRATMMAALVADWSMVALTGIDASTARRLIESLKQTPEFGLASIANINARDQVVLVGSNSALRELESRASILGNVNARQLEVAVISHCSLLSPVAAAL